MLSDLSSPVLSLAADVVKDLEGEVAVCSLWTVFTKCKSSIQDGRRLENLSWRLWHREMSMSTSAASQINPPFPSPIESTPSPETDLPVLVSPIASPVLGATVSTLPKGVPSPIIHPLTSMPSLDTIASPRPRSLPAVGKIICDILPEKIILPPRQPPPPELMACTVNVATPSPVLFTTVSTLLTPTTSTTGVPPFPKVVIVNPTPHPTPPATPLSSHQVHHTGLNPISHLPSHLAPGRPPASPSRTSGLVSATPDVNLNTGTTLAVPNRLQVLPSQLAIPPQYGPRPPTSQLAQQHAGTCPVQPTATTAPKHVAVPEFPAVGQPVLSYQSRFFFRESPEQIDSSPDGVELRRVGGDDKTNNGDATSENKASWTENAQIAPSERSDSLDVDLSAHTVMSSSVGSKDSRGSTSLPRNKKPSSPNVPTNNTRATARRKAARPARPLMARMNSRMSQHKRTKSNSNVPMATNLAMTRTTSRQTDTADLKEKVKDQPSPVTLEQPNLTPTNATVIPRQQAPPSPAIKKKGNSTNSRENPLPTSDQVDLQHLSKTPIIKQETPVAQSQRRGIVAQDGSSSSNSEFETEDSDDSEWASEEVSQVEDEKPSAKTNEKSAGKNKKKENEAARRAREVTEEEERKRRDQELFAKLPRKSYTNLPEGVAGVGGVESLYGPPRTRSGLLTQLLNPDPAIFPVNHPYRSSFSSQDITAYSRMNPALSMTRVQAAIPQATRTQVTVNNYPTTQINGSGARPNDLRTGGKYRPRGRPDGAEMDDSDGEEDDNKLEVSTSLAQQRLAALVGPGRRGRSKRQNSDPPPQSNLSMSVVNHQVVDHSHAVNPNNVTPIPLHHPYNLPPPTAPSTPRTTRRHMLSTELSESLRRNLLWERQVSKVGGQPYQRRPVSALIPGIRPLTSVNEGQASGSGSRDTDNPKPQSKEERRKKALDRNRSWADDFHTAGW